METIDGTKIDPTKQVVRWICRTKTGTWICRPKFVWKRWNYCPLKAFIEHASLISSFNQFSFKENHQLVCMSQLKECYKCKSAIFCKLPSTSTVTMALLKHTTYVLVVSMRTPPNYISTRNRLSICTDHNNKHGYWLTNNMESIINTRNDIQEGTCWIIFLRDWLVSMVDKSPILRWACI